MYADGSYDKEMARLVTYGFDAVDVICRPADLVDMMKIMTTFETSIGEAVKWFLSECEYLGKSPIECLADGGNRYLVAIAITAHKCCIDPELFEEWSKVMANEVMVRWDNRRFEPTIPTRIFTTLVCFSDRFCSANMPALGHVRLQHATESGQRVANRQICTGYKPKPSG